MGLAQQVFLNASARYSAATRIEFNSNQMAEISGVSLRQLQWWDEKGIVSPGITQTGHVERRYSTRHALAVMVVAELRAKGFSLQRVRIALKGIIKVISGDLAEVMAGRANLFLVIEQDGRKFRFTGLREQALDYAIASMRPVVVVAIQPMVKLILAYDQKEVN